MRIIENIIAGFITLLVGISVLGEFSKGVSLRGWTPSDEPQQNKRQTYKEYVEERLEVERLMKQ